MAWNPEGEAVLKGIEQEQAASKKWHMRHEDALFALGAVSRTIEIAYGQEAGILAYNTGLADLRARDPL